MRRRRATAQRLPVPRAGAVETVRALLAVQAQDARSARLALRARGVGSAEEDGLCVTWLMRGTLHLVCVEDLAWLHAVTAPRLVRPALRRLSQLGVADPDAVVARIDGALKERGPGSREDLARLLGLGGQALANALLLAGVRGVLVRSLDGTFRPAGGLLPAVDRDAALLELGRRYAPAHPGADAQDLARWAGIPLRDVRLPADAPAPADDAGLPPVPPRLLAPFDPYMLGWRDRAFAVPAHLAARVFPGGGMFRATATVDGEVVGTWSAARGRVGLDVPDPEPFRAEAQAVEAFLRSSVPGTATE